MGLFAYNRGFVAVNDGPTGYFVANASRRWRRLGVDTRPGRGSV
jgi:hypothetical protein